MSRFVNGEERTEVRAEWWDEGECVTIRKLGFLDRRYISGQSTTYGPPDEEGKRSVYVDMEAMDLAILERGIADWSLKGEDGKRAPLSKGMLRRLGERDGEFIVNAIHEFNPRRSAEEQASFRAAAGDGAAE